MTPLHRSAAVRRARRRLTILRSTGRWRPSRTVLAASGNAIHVDPDDERGWEIVRGLGRGHQPALIDLWRRSLGVLEPDLALDVGANYGEMVLSGSYPAGTAVVAVEPNPRVAALLARSLAEHADRERIELATCLVSDPASDGTTATLHVDPRWSGTASASPLDAATGDTEAVTVPVRSLDALTAARGPASRLLVKIDAEGWEAQVLAGMARLLAEADQVVAIIEFDPDHLRRAGTDPDGLYARIAAIGACWSVAHDGTSAVVLDAPTDATDLLVVSDPAVADRLRTP